MTSEPSRWRKCGRRRDKYRALLRISVWWRELLPRLLRWPPQLPGLGATSAGVYKGVPLHRHAASVRFYAPLH